MVPNSCRSGSKLENTNLRHSFPPLEFFKFFITDDFLTKMAEQTNFYPVQRGAPQSFKPVSDGVINLHVYLYINIHTDSGRRLETIFGCSLCKTSPLLNVMLCWRKYTIKSSGNFVRAKWQLCNYILFPLPNPSSLQICFKH